jgi:uracil DNA glycosylase
MSHILDFFRCPLDWSDFFYDDDNLELIEQIQNETTEPHLLAPFYNISYNNINVVLIGDDPRSYSYSIHTISKAFQSIYKELEKEGFYPIKDGNTFEWTKQGVLFFTSPLVCPDTGSVSELIRRIIVHLSKKDVIWVLLGDHKNLKEMLEITNQKIYSYDPLKKEFDGCNVFKKINNDLFQKGKDKISW